MAAVRERIDRDELSPGGDVHREHRYMYELTTHPRVVEPMASILGPDLIMKATAFFHKRSGDPGVRRHQDTAYWDLEPPLNPSARVAGDAVVARGEDWQAINHRVEPPTEREPPESVLDRPATGPGSVRTTPDWHVPARWPPRPRGRGIK